MENEMLEQTNEEEFVDGAVEEEKAETDTDEEVEEESTEEEQQDNEQEEKSLQELLKENPKYQEQFNTMMKKRVNRIERSHDEELSKYRELTGIVGKSMNTDNVDDTLARAREFYKEKGIEYTPPRSMREEEILANGEADDIIASCDNIEDLKAEADNLASIGKNNMTQRQKLIFKRVVEEINSQERISELNKIGAKESIYNSTKFKDYVSMFKPNTPISKIYSMYEKENGGNKEKKPIGSMKNTPSKKNEIKDFYSKEEALKFTREDFDKNPKLFAAVEKSMSKW